MYYTINIHDEEEIFCRTHKEISETINLIIKRRGLNSNFTTKNIVANWLCRNNKSKKWNFVRVEKHKSKKSKP